MPVYADLTFNTPGRHIHLDYLENGMMPSLCITMGHRERLVDIVADDVTIKHYAFHNGCLQLIGTYCSIPTGFQFEGSNVISLSVRSENYEAAMITLHEVKIVTVV